MAKRKQKRPRPDSSDLSSVNASVQMGTSHPPKPSQLASLTWQLIFWLPLWVGLTVALSVVVSTTVGRLDSQTALFSMLCALLPVVFLTARQASFPDLGCPGKWGWLAIGVFSVVLLRLFVWGTVEVVGSIKVLLPNNLGDASLHLALVNFLSSSPSFWPVSPWFAPSPLSYPPGTDLFDALMVVLVGQSPIEQIALTSLLMAVPLIAILWGWSRAFGVALLLFCAPLSDLLLLVGKVPEESSWKSLILTVIAPQRGMLVAIPLGLSFLVMARHLCTKPSALTSSWPTLTLLFLPLAVLPIFSVHAVLALLPVAAWTAVILGRRAMILLVMTALLSLIPSAWLLDLLSRGGHLRFEQFACPNWGASTLSCLLKNFGLLLPLLGWLLVQGAQDLVVKSPRKPERTWDHLASVYFPALFLLSLFIASSPWGWDNTKLMIWAVLGSAPFVWSEVLSRFPTWFRVFAISLLVLPGAGSLYDALNSTRHGYEIGRASEVREATAARKSVPPGAVLAAAPDYNHPWFLAGHAFFLGYEGWIWSHGLDSAGRRKALSEVLSGSAGWEKTANDSGITHIVWSEREKKLAGRGKSPAASRWPAVFRGKTVTVYANPARPAPARR